VSVLSHEEEVVVVKEEEDEGGGEGCDRSRGCTKIGKGRREK